MLIIVFSSFFFALAIGLILTEKLERFIEFVLIFLSFYFFVNGIRPNFISFVLLFMLFRSLFSNILNLFVDKIISFLKK